MAKHFSRDFLSGSDATKGTYDGAPIALTATTVIEANGSGEMPADALRSPEGVAFEIYEVKWHIVANEQVLGNALEVSFTYRGIPLTNNFVPLWGLAKCDAQRIENTTYPEDGGYVGVGSAAARGVSTGVWRFDHPVYVDPGETIIPKFNNTGVVTKPITVVLTYTGRVTKQPPPKKRWLPYIAAFNTPVITLSGQENTTQRFSSSQKDLVNKCGQTLHVKRFVGRVATYGTTVAVIDGGESSGGYTYAVTHNFESGPSEYADVGAELVTVRMRDSRGYRTVREYTPFRSVFGAVTRSWECPHDLPPDAYYILDAAVVGVPTAVSGVPDDLRTQLSVCMIGWQGVLL